ncbi:MAG: hypothetical protein NXI24_01410 [bacterium]|nr:hypothetical protein [bacterium]
MKQFRKFTVISLIACISLLGACSTEEDEPEAEGLDEDTALLLVAAVVVANNNAAANSSCRQNIAGCTSSRFSCDASNSCYTSIVACANSGDCPVGTAAEFGPLSSSANADGGFVAPELVEGVDYTPKSL